MFEASRFDAWPRLNGLSWPIWSHKIAPIIGSIWKIAVVLADCVADLQDVAAETEFGGGEALSRRVYTRARLPVSLAYVEPCESLSAALKRERQLKPWSHAQKEALIAGDVALLK